MCNLVCSVCVCAHVCVCLVCVTMLFVCVQDEDPRVAETAVVGYGHEDYGEGTVAILLIQCSLL